jgi:hypothetical protein
MKKLRSAVVVLLCLALAGLGIAACSSSRSKPGVTYEHPGMIYDGFRLPKHWPVIPATMVKPVLEPKTGNDTTFGISNVVSSNIWAGYIAPFDGTSAYNSSEPSIEAQITAPPLDSAYCKQHHSGTDTAGVTTPGNPTGVAAWIGLGGVSTGLLVYGNKGLFVTHKGLLTQVGIDAYCKPNGSGGANYRAFVEDVGEVPTPADQQPWFGSCPGTTTCWANAGDTIDLEMIQGSGSDLYTVYDETTAQVLLQYPIPIPPSWIQYTEGGFLNNGNPPSGPPCGVFCEKGFDDTTAEAIVEDPAYNGGVDVYAKYDNPIQFTNLFMDDTPFSDSIPNMTADVFQDSSADGGSGQTSFSAWPYKFTGPEGTFGVYESANSGPPRKPGAPTSSPTSSPTPTSPGAVPVPGGGGATVPVPGTGGAQGSQPTPKPSPPAGACAAPSANAVAAWKATANEAGNLVGASLKQIAGELSCPVRIAELNQLAALPLSELDEGTPQQQAEGNADIKALDGYFGTPGLFPGTGSNTGGTPTTPPSTPPPSTQPAPSPGPAPSPTSTGPPANALAAWQATASDDSAELSTAFTEVASDLPSSDATQIQELDQLASIPATDATPAQQAEAQTDVTALDTFFNTPGLTPG